MSFDRGFRRNPNVAWRRETRGGEKDGILLFNYETRDIHFMEGAGKVFWENLDDNGLNDVKTARVYADGFSKFIKGFEKRCLIEPDPNNPTTATRFGKGDLKGHSHGGMWSRRVYFDAPLFVQFDCTNQCNLRCRHCVTHGGEVAEGELPTEAALALIKKLAGLGVFQIGFSGGEPLLREDLFTLMEEVKKQGMRLQLTTNATLVDKKVALQIKKLDPVTVGVSLEGSTKETFESIRGKGSYERFIQGVKALVEAGAPVKFKTAVFKENLDEIEGIIELALSLEVKAVDMFLFYPQGRGAELKNQSLNPIEIKNLLTSLSYMRDRYEGLIEVDVDDKPNAFLVDPDLSHSTCGAGVYWAEILPNGDVVPCIFYRDIVAGNISRTGFKEAWNSSIWDPFRDRRGLKGRCGSCQHR